MVKKPTLNRLWGLFRPQTSVGPPYDKTVTYVRSYIWHITRLIKVVAGGSHGYFFEVKVETVKLIGGRWFLRLLYMSAQIVQMMAFTQTMVIWTPWRCPKDHLKCNSIWDPAGWTEWKKSPTTPHIFLLFCRPPLTLFRRPPLTYFYFLLTTPRIFLIFFPFCPPLRISNGIALKCPEGWLHLLLLNCLCTLCSDEATLSEWIAHSSVYNLCRQSSCVNSPGHSWIFSAIYT